jgi:hypothetical protein
MISDPPKKAEKDRGKAEKLVSKTLLEDLPTVCHSALGMSMF